MRVVPLVIFKDGEKKQIGEAAVHDRAQVDEVVLEGVLKTSTVFGSLRGPLSIS